MSCPVDAKEGKHVIVTNLALFYMHMNDMMHMLLEGTISECITKLEPSI